MFAEKENRTVGKSGRSKSEVWLKRANRIEAAIAKEPWLPIGLRSLLAIEIPEVCKDLKSGRRARAWRNVHRLALMSFRYGPRLLDSEAVAQLRILDLEMSEPSTHGSHLTVGKSIGAA
ncbi:hypothetical protein IEN85_17140 [Pelagicoccus sp. NFK12]|uniref:Uncharacterized protein n=1 Tax=Pelagicoccus enzymogenes TaxID=2773457 RepID=A0A927IIV5_9BACT|nr:hypothetical protein [Pelagicoccus enzymogenes]MBD5781229.1 hypothetical protein [Pelagicoccus enzymogenes]